MKKDTPEAAQLLADERKKNAELRQQFEEEKKLRNDAESHSRRALANAQVDFWEREGRLSGNSTKAFRAMYVAVHAGEQVTAEMVSNAVATLPRFSQTHIGQQGASAVTLQDFALAATNADAGRRIMSAVDDRRKRQPNFSADDLRRELEGKS